MQSLFNYQTLKIGLVKKTKTLQIEINRPEHRNAINLELLFELESIFAWASNRVEIASILITTENDCFSVGFDPIKLEKLNENQIIKINEKLQKIVHAMMHLPQTIIVDLKKGAQNLGCELALGADIRLCHNEVSLEFNHPKLGLTAGAGGLGLLTSIIGQIHARNWLLSGKTQYLNTLKSSGFIMDSYTSNEERNFVLEEVLENIASQAPVARIQTKLGILSPFLDQFENANKLDRQISKATLVTGDWKNVHEDETMKAKSMSYAVKLSLVKDENSDLRN